MTSRALSACTIHVFCVDLWLIIVFTISALSRPPTIFLKITDCSFRYASPRLWNQLPDSFRQPHHSRLDSLPHPLLNSSLSSRHPPLSKPINVSAKVREKPITCLTSFFVIHHSFTLRRLRTRLFYLQFSFCWEKRLLSFRTNQLAF